MGVAATVLSQQKQVPLQSVVSPAHRRGLILLRVQRDLSMRGSWLGLAVQQSLTHDFS